MIVQYLWLFDYFFIVRNLIGKKIKQILSRSTDLGEMCLKRKRKHEFRSYNYITATYSNFDLELYI